MAAAAEQAFDDVFIWGDAIGIGHREVQPQAVAGDDVARAAILEVGEAVVAVRQALGDSEWSRPLVGQLVDMLVLGFATEDAITHLIGWRGISTAVGVLRRLELRLSRGGVGKAPQVP